MRVIRRRVIWAVAGLAVAAPLAARQSERFALRGAHVAIYNIAGEITLEAGPAQDVVIELRRGGSDASRLDVATGAIGGRETLRVLYPSDRVVYRRDDRRGFNTTLRVRPDGTFGDADDRGRAWRQDDRVEVSSRGRGLDGHADLRVVVPRGQRIDVYLAAGRVTATNVEGRLRLDTHAASVTARGIRGSLLVDVGSGSVDVSDVEGDTDLDTGSGSVRASNVRGDNLRIDTGSGSVTATNVTARTLLIDTGSGGIELTAAVADRVVLDTGSGSVGAVLTGSARDVTIDTGSGGVTLTLPADFGADVSIETGSGGIDVDIPLQLRRWERTAVSGTIGDGRGRLVIDTGSGSVRIRGAGQ